MPAFLCLRAEREIPLPLRAKKQAVGRIFLIECADKLFKGQHVVPLKGAAFRKREVRFQPVYKLLRQKFHGGDDCLVNPVNIFPEDFAERVQDKRFFINQVDADGFLFLCAVGQAEEEGFRWKIPLRCNGG